MSAKGRGNFLYFQAEASSCSGISNSSGEISIKDSGLGSRSPVSTGEYRRVGRGKLLDDLTSTSSNLSSTVGRGRAYLIDSFKENDFSQDQDMLYQCGRGQAQIQLEPVTYDKPDATSKIENNPVEAERDTSNPFFNPRLHGHQGIHVELACNFIKLHSDQNKGVYVYEVRFNPNVDSMNLRMKYLNEHRLKFGGTKTFDGVTLYLPILLGSQLTTYVSKSTFDTSNIEIRILFKRKESMKNCIHLYNVLFDRVMKTLNYVRFDRKQFDPTAPKLIPHSKLEVWPGYVTAVDEYEGGLMLCCDVSHRLLCQQTVLEMLIDIYKSHPKQCEEKAKNSLLGSVVITRYNNRTYRIDDICFDKNPLSTFTAKDSSISYIDYYRTNHNIEIKDKKQPLLISIKKQRQSDKNTSEELMFCLIPEICYLTGLRDEIRSNHELMREIATFTRVSPNQRLLALEQFYGNVSNSSEARGILENWGLSLSKPCEYISGRQMKEEQIVFAKKSFSAGLNADFSRYATINELLHIVNLQNWLLIHCKVDNLVAKSFCDNMYKNSYSLGIQIQTPKTIVLDIDRVDTYINALRKNIQKDTQIVVCICPSSRDDRYAAIKKVCCAEIPIPSQVINAKTLLKESKNRAIVQKIALQINCKLGGSLWTVKIPFTNVMICGIDSYHDAAQKGNSVAAFVASLNQTYTMWYSKAVIQSKKEEIVNGLCSSFVAALEAYKKENGGLPSSVIIYRDGVGDGQLHLCANYEVPQLEAACLRNFKNYTLKITFIVVQKRINTRYFTMNGGEANNPPPGTIIDATITRNNMYDFFLVSQSVRKGTVSPTHYIVLRDDSNYNADIIQRLSYKLCFLYYNWPGTIRIPACCQYAHKMAYLIGQSIRRVTSEELAKQLFYL